MRASYWLAGSSSQQPQPLIGPYISNAFADLSVDINRMFGIFRIARALSKVKEMADYLKTKFPGTDKEREKDNFVFQHAKNILIASFQRILYNEYLPKVLGDKYMTEYQLKTPESSHSEYDQYSNAMMLHEFVTFAYRW